MDIYDRQLRVWTQRDQRFLENTKITISGSNIISQYVASGLAALGIGNISIIDNSRVDSQFDFLIPKVENGTSTYGKMKCHEISKRAKSLNHLVDVESYYAKPTYGLLKELESDILIETTNDPFSKEILYTYSEDYSKKMYNLSANESRGVLRKPINKSQAKDTCIGKINPLVGGTLSGLLLDDIRKEIFTLQDDEKMAWGSAFNYQLPRIKNDYGNALIIGAGALGNFAGVALASTNTDFMIMDNDEIEQTNLNRQIMFYQAVGRPKAEVLANRLSKLNPNTKIDYSLQAIEESNIDIMKNFDIILGCVDNQNTRYLLSNAALSQKKLYIDGSTDVTSGMVSAYHPGKNHSLECRNNYSMNIRAGHSCVEQETMPSVIMTNMFTGTQLAIEALTLNLQGNESLHFDSNGSLKYNILDDDTSAGCNCYV